MLTGEPAVVVGVIVVALTAIQQAALNISPSVHAVIAIVLIVLGALVTRSQVTPVAAKRRAARHR